LTHVDGLSVRDYLTRRPDLHLPIREVTGIVGGRLVGQRVLDGHRATWTADPLDRTCGRHRRQYRGGASCGCPAQLAAYTTPAAVRQWWAAYQKHTRPTLRERLALVEPAVYRFEDATNPAGKPTQVAVLDALDRSRPWWFDVRWVLAAVGLLLLLASLLR
jgi:hypothetical protein